MWNERERALPSGRERRELARGCRSDPSPWVAAQGWGVLTTILASQKSDSEMRPGAWCGLTKAVAYGQFTLLRLWTHYFGHLGLSSNFSLESKVHCPVMARGTQPPCTCLYLLAEALKQGA